MAHTFRPKWLRFSWLISFSCWCHQAIKEYPKYHVWGSSTPQGAPVGAQMYPQKPKICKFQHDKKRCPRAESGIWHDGSSIFDGITRPWAFGLAKLVGKAISIKLLSAPSINSFCYVIEELLKDGADRNLMKMAFLAILASPKAQNLIIPSKIDDPSCQIPYSARGQHFPPCWSLHIFCFWGCILALTRAPWGEGLPPTLYLRCPLIA